jgi:hypothetical protein
MSKNGRQRNTNGSVYQRSRPALWRMRYWDATGTIRKESTGETDRQEAERALKEPVG